MTVLACVTNAKEVSSTEWSLGCVFSLELSESEMKALGGEKKASRMPDQRAWVRYPAKGTVKFRVLPGGGTTLRSAELVDLSPTGVGLVVEEKIEPGSALTVLLRQVNDKPDRAMLTCAVYLTERPDGKWAVGCQFLHPERGGIEGLALAVRSVTAIAAGRSGPALAGFRSLHIFRTSDRTLPRPCRGTR